MYFMNFNQNWRFLPLRWTHKAGKAIHVLVCHRHARQNYDLRSGISSLAIFCSSHTKNEPGPTKNVGFLLNTHFLKNQLCLQKVCLYALKLKISYIFVNGLMANFKFWGYRTIFERGHRCKKNSGISTLLVKMSSKKFSSGTLPPKFLWVW